MKKIELTFAVLVFILSTVACGQQTDTNLWTSMTKDTTHIEPIDDSLMFKTLGDSICEIVLNAKSVEVSLSTYSDSTDSIVCILKKLNNKETSVVKFLVSDPKNFVHNTIVYGQFLPNISFTFLYKKKGCKIKFDFGLKKQCVYDSNDKVLKMTDLSSMEMLRFAHSIYPEYDFFVNLLNYQQK